MFGSATIRTQAHLICKPPKASDAVLMPQFIAPEKAVRIGNT
jgi:hypothetical protein